MQLGIHRGNGGEGDETGTKGIPAKGSFHKDWHNSITAAEQAGLCDSRWEKIRHPRTASDFGVGELLHP
jgi:hypothetical protein